MNKKRLHAAERIYEAGKDEIVYSGEPELKVCKIPDPVVRSPLPI